MLIQNPSEVRDYINSVFPHEVEHIPFRAPASKDGADVSHYGLWYDDQLLSLPTKSGFVPHTRDDIAAITEAALIAMGTKEYNVKAHWTGEGHSVTIQPSKDYIRGIAIRDKNGNRLTGHNLGEPDEVIFKGYIDGRFGRPFTFSCGMWRPICENGAIVEVKDQKTQVKIRHTTQLRSRMDELVESLSYASDAFENIVARMRQYADTKVKISEFLSQLYPAPEATSGKARTQFDNTMEKILTRLHHEAMRTGNQILGGGLEAETNLWLMVNAITGYVQHDKVRHGAVSRARREQLALDDVESRKAWELASSIAG